MKKLLPKTRLTPEGFTLIELLVAISIIAILSIAGLIIFQGAQKNARDGRRRQDIDAIAQALETNKVAGSTSTSYPALADTYFASGTTPSDSTNPYCVASSTTSTALIAKPTTWTQAGACSTLGATWNTVSAGATPQPPANTLSWTVCALLENGTNPGNIYCKSSSQ